MYASLAHWITCPTGQGYVFLSRDIKQRQAAQTPCVVFVVAPHYPAKPSNYCFALANMSFR